MFSRITKRWIGIVFAILLAGCANHRSVPALPTALNGNGLLVARIYVLGLHAMENASINIDGKLLNSSLRDGYIAVSLAPGEHTFSQIRAEGQLLSRNVVADNSPFRLTRGGGGHGGGHTPIYVPGSSYVIHYTTLAVDRTFKIEPGKVTNLGLIVYLPVVDNPNTKRATVNNSRQFNVVTLDNGVETDAFLKANYPDLIKSMPDYQITSAPGNYMDLKNLPALRRAIAFHERLGPHVVVASPEDVFVYGKAGTIVEVKNKGGLTTPTVNVLDTGTLADIVGGIKQDGKSIFLTSDAKILSWDGSKLSSSALPYPVQPIRLHTLGKDGLFVVDNHLRILTAHNPSDSWTNYEGVMQKTPRDDIQVSSDNSGAYVTVGSRGIPENIYYIKSDDATPEIIMRPAMKPGMSTTDLHFIVARDAGLFILYNKQDYYFYSKAGKNWQVHSLPQKTCNPVKIDPTGENLSVECDNIQYQSNNSGATWTRKGV